MMFFNFVYLQIVHKLLFQTSSNLTIFDTKRARKLATKGGLTSKYLLTSQPAKPAASSIINRVTAFFYGRKFVIPKGSNFYNLWYEKGKRISCQRSYFGIPVTFTNNKNIELHSHEFNSISEQKFVIPNTFNFYNFWYKKGKKISRQLWLYFGICTCKLHHQQKHWAAQQWVQ